MTSHSDVDRGLVWVPFRRSRRLGVAADGSVTAESAASEELPRRLLAAQPGDVVEMPVLGEPPWTVVHLDPTNGSPDNWPGRLLEVRLPPAKTPAEADAVAAGLRSPRWRRAHAIEVLAERDASPLFGANGHAILPVF